MLPLLLCGEVGEVVVVWWLALLCVGVLCGRGLEL